MSLRGHLLLREERHPAGLQCRCDAALPGDMSMYPAILSHRAGWFVFVRLLVCSETRLWPGRPLTPRPFWLSACQWKWSRVPPRSHCDGQQELSKHVRVKKSVTEMSAGDAQDKTEVKCNNKLPNVGPTSRVYGITNLIARIWKYIVIT